MAYRAVFFDAGFTLVHAYPSLGGIYREVSRRHGFDIAVEPLEALLRGVLSGSSAELGPTRWHDLETSDAHEYEMWRDITARVHHRLGWPLASFESWFADLWRAVGDGSSWQVFEDVVPALDDLVRRGLRVGIVSNWDSRLTDILEALGLRDRFECVVASAQVRVRKPSPAIFRHALDRMGVAPEAAVMVGDTLRDDVEGARAVGLTGVLVDRHGRHAGVRDVPVVRSLLDLPACLGF